MKKYIVILFFVLFSIVGLGTKQEIRHEEEIITDKRISLGPIIIYNYKDYSEVEARQKEFENNSIEEAHKTMSPEEFEKWKPWMANVIRCNDCIGTSTSYGLPFVYSFFYSGFGSSEPFRLLSLILNLIIYFVLAFLIGSLIFLRNKKRPISQPPV